MSYALEMAHGMSSFEGGEAIAFKGHGTCNEIRYITSHCFSVSLDVYTDSVQMIVIY